MVGVRLSCSGLNLSDNNRMSSRVVSMVSNNLLISFTMHCNGEYGDPLEFE